MFNIISEKQQKWSSPIVFLTIFYTECWSNVKINDKKLAQQETQRALLNKPSFFVYRTFYLSLNSTDLMKTEFSSAYVYVIVS